MRGRAIRSVGKDLTALLSVRMFEDISRVPRTSVGDNNAVERGRRTPVGRTCDFSPGGHGSSSGFSLPTGWVGVGLCVCVAAHTKQCQMSVLGTVREIA